MNASPRLAERLAAALSAGDAAELAEACAHPVADRRDRLECLLRLYEVVLGPLVLGPPGCADAARLAAQPEVAALKWRLEQDWLAELSATPAPAGLARADLVGAIRTMAARDRLPEVYRWLAERASWGEVVDFLAVEGGPDSGFDDLVAHCQVGLPAGPKMELARNYWDELGGGDPDEVHAHLYEQLVAAVEMPRVPLRELPEAALARAALGGLLATNRWLQPELVGALGMVELQAGPRCRMVLRAFDRCGAPAAAYPFYRVHAEVDPRHGRDWLEKAIAPLAAEHPEWAPRILQGAWWRTLTNAAFFAALRPARRRQAA